MSMPSESVKKFLAWMETIPDSEWPLAWEVTGKKSGRSFICGPYASREEAESAIQQINLWAEAGTVAIQESWNTQKSENDWKAMGCP